MLAMTTADEQYQFNKPAIGAMFAFGVEENGKWHTGSSITFLAVRRSNTRRQSPLCIPAEIACQKGRSSTLLARRWWLDHRGGSRFQGELGAFPGRYSDAPTEKRHQGRAHRATTGDRFRSSQLAEVNIFRLAM